MRSAERRKVALIVTLVVVATVLHYGIDVEAGPVHDVLLRSYYLPIILGGLWFGVRGGLATSAAVSIVFFPHALHGWHAPYTFVYRLIEILMYNVIGALTGAMSSRARDALAAETSARLERERAYDDLRERTEALFATEEQLRRSERLAALGRMSAGLAHEIRNPLSSIKTSVEMLRDKARPGCPDPSPERTTELLQVLGEETDRLNRILTEFLSFARVESRADGGSTGPSVVGDVLANTAALTRHDMATANVRLRFDGRALDLHTAVPEDPLRQVLLNLVLNAVDAMPEGGEIRVRAVETDIDTIVIAVEDDGHGIPSETARSIFDPFFSTKVGGSGLGLSIVARLLEANGGAIELDGRYQRGARFLVRLPRTAGREG